MEYLVDGTGISFATITRYVRTKLASQLTRSTLEQIHRSLSLPLIFSTFLTTLTALHPRQPHSDHWRLLRQTGYQTSQLNTRSTALFPARWIAPYFPAYQPDPHARSPCVIRTDVSPRLSQGARLRQRPHLILPYGKNKSLAFQPWRWGDQRTINQLLSAFVLIPLKHGLRMICCSSHPGRKRILNTAS